MPSSYEIKERDVEFIPQRTYTEIFIPTGQPTQYQYNTVRAVGRETTRSRKNLWRTRNELLAKWAREGRTDLKNSFDVLQKGDFGGEFENTKRYCEYDQKMVNILNKQSVSTYQYIGPQFARANDVGPMSVLYPVVPTNLRDLMIAKGTTAIARTLPTNPVAGAAQFLGELRERLPSVPGKALIGRQGSPSALADEYLNLEFGLKPIISDLQKFGEAIRTSNKVLDQLRRDSGRVVRRRYHFPEEVTIDAPVVTTNQTSYPALRGGLTGGYVGSGFGKLTKTRQTSVKYWFSGAYSYVFAENDSVYGRLKNIEQRAGKLFGLRLTPELLWELAPWSWAADWVTNAGDVIHNLSAFANDSLVMRYGYVMCTYTITDTYLLEGIVFRDGTSGPMTQSFTTQVKKRVKATPYGFGLDADAFTPRQWAILGSIGITKGRDML